MLGVKSWQDLTSMAPEDAINNSNFKDQLKKTEGLFFVDIET